MEFRVLGPFEVLVEGRSVDLGGTKRRAVLAVLALHANEVVSTDRLVDELWGEKAPRNAGAALHNHVSRIRKALGPDAVVTKPWGYVLRADPEAIDARRFERLVRGDRPIEPRERVPAAVPFELLLIARPLESDPSLLSAEQIELNRRADLLERAWDECRDHPALQRFLSRPGTFVEGGYRNHVHGRALRDAHILVLVS